MEIDRKSRWGTTFGVLRVPDDLATPGGGPILVSLGCRIFEIARGDSKRVRAGGMWGALGREVLVTTDLVQFTTTSDYLQPRAVPLSVNKGEFTTAYWF